MASNSHTTEHKPQDRCGLHRERLKNTTEIAKLLNDKKVRRNGRPSSGIHLLSYPRYLRAGSAWYFNIATSVLGVIFLAISDKDLYSTRGQTVLSLDIHYPSISVGIIS